MRDAPTVLEERKECALGMMHRKLARDAAMKSLMPQSYTNQVKKGAVSDGSIVRLVRLIGTNLICQLIKQMENCWLRKENDAMIFLLN